MKRTTIAAMFLLGSACMLPATAANATPINDGWAVATAVSGVQRITTPGIDREWVEVEDIDRNAAGEPMRYAVPMQRVVTPASAGTWDRPATGLRRWRVELASPGATSINLGFGRYRLPDGASLRLLDADGKQPFRSFTSADNDDHGQLWTPPVPGEAITVELLVPERVADAVELQLDAINHGYRGFGETPWFAKSGPCNIDVACPLGDDWSDQIRATAGFSSNGSLYCSGALINNLANDGRPLLLSAHHCGAGNAASVVVVWNYKNSFCRTGGAAGGPGNGVKTQFNTGSILRARRADTDFMLLELDDPINPDFDLYFAGFDAREQATSNATGIHHPDGQEMRISVSDQPTTFASYGGSPPNSHLRVVWDHGTTEPGSSGSPLYSPEKRIVGQLHGGGASCSNLTAPDYYGRVAMSWDGADAATRLRDWLDPANTGERVLDGRDVSGFELLLDDNSALVCSTDSIFTSVVTVLPIEDFALDVVLGSQGVPAGLDVSFHQGMLAPFTSTEFMLDDFDAVGAGVYQFAITGSADGRTVAKTFMLEVAEGLPAAPTLLQPADDAQDVPLNVVLVWDAVPQATAYRIEVATDAAFADPVFDQTLDATTVTLTDEVETLSDYHWRVTAISPCGSGGASPVASFRTGASYCDVPGLGIPSGTTLERTLVLPPDAGTIVAVTVPFAATHPYIGDLVASLTHGGVTRRLVEQPGAPASPTGCAGNDADIVFDDAATASAQTDCNGGDNAPGYIDGGTYRPLDTFTPFVGMDAAGAWTIAITDVYPEFDDGTLDRWCIEVTPEAEPLPPEIFDDGFE